MDLVQQNKDAYNAIAKHFSATRNALWPEFDKFTPFFAKSQRILDWGCGNGRPVFMLEGKGVEYHGVDQSEALLEQAKTIHAKAITEGWVHFHSSANGEIEFPAEYFDNVLMIASFFHLPDQSSRIVLLKKTHHELKPGGHLLMTLWNLESDWANTKKPNWKILGENDYLIPWKDQTGKVLADRYYHHFTETEIKKLLEEVGFKIEQIGFSNGIWTDDKGGRNMLVIAAKP